MSLPILFFIRALKWTKGWVPVTASNLKQYGDVIYHVFDRIEEYYDYYTINTMIPSKYTTYNICIVDSGMYIMQGSTFNNLNNISNIYCTEKRYTYLISRILIYKYADYYDFHGKFKPKILPCKKEISYTSDIVFHWVGDALKTMEENDLEYFRNKCSVDRLSADSPSFSLKGSQKVIKTRKSILTSDLLYYFYLSNDNSAESKLFFNNDNPRTKEALENIKNLHISSKITKMSKPEKFNYINIRSLQKGLNSVINRFIEEEQSINQFYRELSPITTYQ